MQLPFKSDLSCFLVTKLSNEEQGSVNKLFINQFVVFLVSFWFL